jgi:general secretion pathway protein J
MSHAAHVLGPASRRAIARGFTLVEALVALALFALIAMVGYRGLSAVIDARTHLDQAERRWRDLDHVFALWRSDLEASIDRSTLNNFGQPEDAFLADFDPGGRQDAALWLTRLGAPGADGLPATPQRIGWRLREHRLERLSWPSPDRGPRSEPEVQPVMDGVATLGLRYLWLASTGPSWDARWRSPVHISLPRAVELSLDLADGHHLVRLFDLPAAPKDASALATGS